MAINEKELKQFYNKHINRTLYRVVSSEYIPEIKKEGLNPEKDPFEKIGPEIKKLFRLILRLEKKGFIHKQDWGLKLVKGSQVVRVSTVDMESPFIDITPNYKETFFYLNYRGGALVNAVKEIVEDVLKRKPKISEKELILVKKMHKWALEKYSYKNKTLFLNGSSKYLESAYFQRANLKKGKKYIESPFGTFEHFKKVVQKNGLETYEPYLKMKKQFWLRLTEKMPAKEIVKIR